MSLTKLISRLEASEKAWDESAKVAIQKARETWGRILTLIKRGPDVDGK